MDKLNSLRKRYPLFLYEGFEYKKDKKTLEISFLFKIPPNIEFKPIVKIKNIDESIYSNSKKKVIDNFIFNLGLVEMISYWKATCSPNIEINAGNLNKNQTLWWKNLLIKGLGEFFYQNNINFKEDKFIHFTSTAKNNFQKDKSTHKDRYLVANSGGRDSIVSLELLKNQKKEFAIFMLNPTTASISTANESQFKKRVVVKREIDKRLLKLNEDGYLNGHTPFSAYLAFLSVLCAEFFDYKCVVFSNERSSNEENVEFLGEKINHQYSKSFEFEKSFREYVKENLSENIEYFSFLRPLYELQISKIFAKYPKYFKVFKSCNRGQKTNSWCGQCPKCLSIYITLYPFIEEKELTEIFGSDLYSKKELLDLLLHITGAKKPKPFECVGTYGELLEGIKLSIEKIEKNNKALPYLLSYSKNNILEPNYKSKEYIESWDEKNFLTDDLKQILKRILDNEF